MKTVLITIHWYILTEKWKMSVNKDFKHYRTPKYEGSQMKTLRMGKKSRPYYERV